MAASALDTLLSGTQSSSTTLPSWYDQAQQNIANTASSAASGVPGIQNTVAQGAIDTLNSPNNPYTSAESTLGTIASGAANPWTTNPTTGAVTPNTDTAMGGLFAAQNQQLQTLLPTYVAPSDASAVAGGGFGSLRNETAADTAVTNAQANLTASQMQAALQNQQTGATAASDLSNTGTQQATTEENLAKYQQAAPLTSVADYAQIIGALHPGMDVTTSQTLPLAGQIGAITSLGNVGSSLIGSLLNGNSTPSTNGTGSGTSSGTGSVTGQDALYSGSTPSGQDSLNPNYGQDTTSGGGWDPSQLS